MPLWSQNLTDADLLAQRPFASPRVRAQARFWRNASTPGLMDDGTGTTFHLAFRHLTGDGVAKLAWLYAAPPTQSTLYPSVALRKALSLRAGLVAALEPAVLSLEVTPLDADTSRLTVVLDKPGSISMFLKGLDANGNETGLITAGDGADGTGSKTLTMDFPRQDGLYRIVVRAGMTKYSRDYDGDVATTSLSTYASPTDDVMGGSYQTGVADGRLAFAQAIYPLADPYGFDSAAVLAGPDWDTDATRQAMVQAIADRSSIDTSKRFLDAMVAKGASPYDGANTDPNYYKNLAVPAADEVYQAGGVGAYHDVYGAYPAFTYDTTSQDGTYLSGLKAGFIAQIQGDGDAAGYDRAYGEVYQAAHDAEITGGLPEGATVWPTSTTSGQAAAVAKHVYEAGFARAAQEIYDQGLADGYDWRVGVDPALEPGDAGYQTQYRDQAAPYKDKMQATGKIAGLRFFLDYIAAQYPAYSYDAGNTAGLDDAAYTTYLEGERNGAVTTVYDTGRADGYRELYDVGVSLFKFSYDPQLDAAALSSLKDSFLTAVYSYAVTSALQETYDLGDSTYFNDLTSYPAIRDPSYVTRTQYLDALAQQLRALEGDFFTRVYESGVIYVYRDRIYPLAEPFGFTFDRAQKQASYYADLEPDFIAALQEGYAGGHIVRVTRNYDPQTFTAHVEVELSRPEGVLLFVTDKDGNQIGSVLESLNPQIIHEFSFPLVPNVDEVYLHVELSNLEDGPSGGAPADGYQYM
ncbi:hypothetical protein [Oceanithermus sp.]|uniref:hypothetical protein n=1 Tax=Oceanithermus sp. TaxID=2268145 RepID=UPI00257DFA8A|nr:hypothetical protein [Oceanithermus sp.]